MRITRGSCGSSGGRASGGREVGVGLVEAEDRAAGEARDHLADAGAGMPAPHRVVGICQVNQWRGGLAGGEEQRLGVLGVVAVGDGDELAAEAGDVVGEGRVGAGGGHDGRAGGDEEADEVAEEAVDAFADGDVRGGDAVVGGERGLELEELGVGVHPAVCGGVGHGGDGGRGRAEDALVGADPGGERAAEGAFLGLRADEGDRGGEAGGEGGQAHGRGCFMGGRRGRRRRPGFLGVARVNGDFLDVQLMHIACTIHARVVREGRIG